MKLNKKYASITTLLGATAVASAFAASATGVTSTTFMNTMNKTFGHYGSHTQNETGTAEQKAHMTASLAAALGTTPEAITAQLTAGKTPRDIIKASGLDEATIKAQLEASHEADMKTRLATDVASGKLTQAQADQMLTDMKNHEGQHADRRGGKMSDQMLIDTASILGTTKEALQTQITAGKTIKDIVTASGISETDFHTKMKVLRTTEMKTRLAADVASGKLTQAQADQMLTDMTNHKEGEGRGHFEGKGKFGNKTTTTSSTTAK